MSLPLARPQKYGNVRIEVDGHVFDSKREAKRYAELKLLQLAGEITALELQPVFELSVVPLTRPTVRVNVGRYTADFRYVEHGQVRVEDVKSTATKTTAYRLRKRMVEAIYGITIAEV
jgi:hypothetical protein